MDRNTARLRVRTTVTGSLFALAAAAALAIPPAGVRSAEAGPAANPKLLVDSNQEGEIRLQALGVSLAETLYAIAEEAQFEVVIDESVPRPPVNLTLPPASVEEVVRSVLHGRNYALFFAEGSDGDDLSRVFVLPPSSPGSRPRAVPARPSRAARRR